MVWISFFLSSGDYSVKYCAHAKGCKTDRPLIFRIDQTTQALGEEMGKCIRIVRLASLLFALYTGSINSSQYTVSAFEL